MSNYCSANVLLSMLCKKTFWLTNLNESNDAGEGRWMMATWLDAIRRSEVQNHTRSKAAKLVLDNTLRKHLPLGVCFSEDPDLLSQWRGYANNGSGFSVTFNADALSKLASSSGDTPSLHFTSLAYGNDRPDHTSRVFAQLKEAFDEDIDRFTEDGKGIVAASLALSPEKLKRQKEAACHLYSAKSSVFKEEKEWRLYAFESVEKMESLKYRIKGDLISPYLEISFPASAVTHVTLGPNNPTDDATVRQLLKSNGFSARVCRARAGYRG